MQERKSFRVIDGGKRGEPDPAADLPALTIEQLRERATQLRCLLSLGADEEALGLADDLDDAIGALCRLGQSDRPEARGQAAEYRALAAEIEAEILGVLKGDV